MWTPFSIGWSLPYIPDKWNVQITEVHTFFIWFMIPSLQTIPTQYDHDQQCSEKYVLLSVSFGQGKSVESVTHCSTCNHTHCRSLATLSAHACNVFSGLQLVQIVEVLDKWGLDCRGCTVLANAQIFHLLGYLVLCINWSVLCKFS